MFNLNEFIITNTVNGVKNGTFTKEYANIMAVNYMMNNMLTQDEVISISTQIEAWETERNTVVDIPIEEPTVEIGEGEINVEDIMTFPEEDTEPKEEVTEEPLTEDDGEPLS